MNTLVSVMMGVSAVTHDSKLPSVFLFLYIFTYYQQSDDKWRLYPLSVNHMHMYKLYNHTFAKTLNAIYTLLLQFSPFQSNAIRKTVEEERFVK